MGKNGVNKYEKINVISKALMLGLVSQILTYFG